MFQYILPGRRKPIFLEEKQNHKKFKWLHQPMEGPELEGDSNMFSHLVPQNPHNKKKTSQNQLHLNCPNFCI